MADSAQRLPAKVQQLANMWSATAAVLDVDGAPQSASRLTDSTRRKRPAAASTGQGALPADATRSARNFHGAGGGDVRRTRAKWINQSTLACQKDPEHVNEVYNPTLVAEFKRLVELYQAIPNPVDKDHEHRLRQYQKQLDILIYKVKFVITTSRQLLLDDGKTLRFKNFGRSGLAKVDEILATGRLRKSAELASDPYFTALKALTSVWGIGQKRARELIDQRIVSVADVRLAASKGVVALTERQRIGLAYHADLQERIPRAEVQEIRAVVLAACAKVYAKLPLVAEVCGSFRRGAQTCGDVDFILSDVSRPNEALRLAPLIAELTARGFLLSAHYREDTAEYRTDDDEDDDDDDIGGEAAEPARREDIAQGHTFMGVCRLPGDDDDAGRKVRRLDIKSFPHDNFAFATLYFTGSAHFNRSMRWFAGKVGYRLSEKALYPVIRNAKHEVVARGAPIRCLTEQDIFHALGLARYLEPHERNCDVRYELTPAAAAAAAAAAVNVAERPATP